MVPYTLPLGKITHIQAEMFPIGYLTTCEFKNASASGGKPPEPPIEGTSHISNAEIDVILKILQHQGASPLTPFEETFHISTAQMFDSVHSYIVPEENFLFYFQQFIKEHNLPEIQKTASTKTDSSTLVVPVLLLKSLLVKVCIHILNLKDG